MCKDKEKKESWSERYKSRAGELKNPMIFIKDNAASLNSGTLLDLACGDGSNAVFLAKEGFQVTGVDFSEEALKRLLEFSEMESVKIATKVVDINSVEEVIALGKFDNIVISRFKPTVETFKILPRLLNKDGKIIFTSFNYKHSEENSFPRKFCLEEGEFANISDSLELIKLEKIEDDGSYLDGYIFKLE